MSRSVTGRRSSGSTTCSSALQISSRDGSIALSVPMRPSPPAPGHGSASHDRNRSPPHQGAGPAPPPTTRRNRSPGGAAQVFLLRNKRDDIHDSPIGGRL